MKRLILASLLICGAAIPAQAQKVYKDGGMYVIECVGMPEGSYTKTPKPRNTDGTNSTLGANTATNLGSAVNNEKIAYKFEVAAADNGVSTWLGAVQLCAGLTGGNWRLPTQRELQLIWIEHGKLKALGMSAFDVNFSWSSTEYGSVESWYVDFLGSNYAFNYRSKTTANHSVRCVRDL